MSAWVRRVIMALGAILMFLFNTLVAASPLLAMANFLGYWTYLAAFVLNTSLMVITFRIILPLNPEDPLALRVRKSVAGIVRRMPLWVRVRLVRLWNGLFPQKSEMSESRLWRFFHGRGAFLAIFWWTWVISPILGVFTARYFRMDERRAWRLTFISVILTTAINVSLALGAWDTLLHLAK